MPGVSAESAVMPRGGFPRGPGSRAFRFGGAIGPKDPSVCVEPVALEQTRVRAETAVGEREPIRLIL